MKLFWKYIWLVTLTGFLSAVSGFRDCTAVSRELIKTASAQTLINNSDRLSQTSREVEGDRLFEESIEDFESDRLSESLEKLQEVLKIRQELEDKPGIGLTAEKIALVSETQGKYPAALAFYNQALLIAEELGDRSSKARIILKIGSMNSVLGRYDRAIESYQQALAIHEEIGDEKSQGTILSNIGSFYRHLQQYEAAINFYKKALETEIENNNRLGEAEILDNLGRIYRQQNNYEEALKQHQQALAIYREQADVKGETYALHNMAVIYRETERYSEALKFLSRALLFQKEVGDREAQRVTLANLAKLFEKAEQSELAIVFYKQSLNLTESIRESLEVKSVEERKSYAEKIAEIYRSFANLLMRTGRSQEAQHVIDLIKVEELHEYLRGIEGNDRTQQGIKLLESEREFWERYMKLINRGVPIHKEITELRERVLERGASDKKTVRHLQKEEGKLENVLGQVNEFVGSNEVTDRVQKIRTAAKEPEIKIDHLVRLQKQLQENGDRRLAILYPLVLENRLEVILVTADAPPIYKTVGVTKVELEEAIAQFRTAVTNRGRAELLGRIKGNKKTDNRVTEPAFKLYEWLIKPIESALELASIKTIIYVGDGKLRYIPLGAFYDGNRWLAQRFNINNATSLHLMDFKSQVNPTRRVLAGGLTEGTFDFEVGREQFNYDYLPYAGVEVETIVAAFPEVEKLVGRDFARSTVVQRMEQNTVIHLATHAAFVEGVPEDSFILFGDGSLVSLQEVREWNLQNVDLIVLSACQTGVGGVLGNGEEILGFGHQLQQAGALASMATLWRVDDRATHEFMKHFYQALKNATNKAEALREAQNTMISGEFHHPYYWAPFILIGNGF